MKLYIPQPIRINKSSLLSDDYEYKKIHLVNKRDNENTNNELYYINISTPPSPEINTPLLNYKLSDKTKELINYNKFKKNSEKFLNNPKLMKKLKQKDLLKKGIDIIINKYIQKVNSEKITFKEKKDYDNLLKFSKYSRLNHIYYLSNDLKKHFYIICKKKANKYINYAYIKEWNDNFPCHIIKLKYFYVFSFSKLHTLID